MQRSRARPLLRVLPGRGRSRFNVTSMSSGRFILLDQASMNQLGEFDTLAEAKETLARFVAHTLEAAADLEIWDDDEDVRIEIDLATLRPAPAA